MKKSIYKVVAWPLACVCILAGCGDRREEPQSIAPLVGGNQGRDTKTQSEFDIQADSDWKARRAAYLAVLEGFYKDCTLPNGRGGKFDDAFYDISDNQFAVCDIDLDGKEELLIEYTTGYMAAMIAVIYDYDNVSNTVVEEFVEYPALTFYENGTIEAEWSHNQGKGGDIWPYSLYQYDQATDSYICVGKVDAWNRLYGEKDYDGNPFPQDIDQDKDGIVYYIMKDDEGYSNPVDLAAYQAWRDIYVGEAKISQVPYKKLTKENIQMLGETSLLDVSLSNKDEANLSVAERQMKEQSFEVNPKKHF